jgi:hypothetical protein
MTFGLRQLLLVAAIASPFSTVGGAIPAVFKAGILARDPFDKCDGLLVPSEQSFYMIDNFGSFALGDTVVVTAAGWDECLCNNYTGYTCLHENTIEAWRDLDLGCGVVDEDDEYHCKGFRSPRYGSFSVRSPFSFGQGDSAHVWGNASLDECAMIPECEFGYCLAVTRAVACPDSGSAARPISWGRIKGLFR